MLNPSSPTAGGDPVWKKLLEEAEEAARKEPVLAELIHDSILNCDSLEASLAHRISRKLGHYALSEPHMHDLFEDVLKSNAYIGENARRLFVCQTLHYSNLWEVTPETGSDGRRQITAGAKNVEHPAVSPNGTWLAYTKGDSWNVYPRVPPPGIRMPRACPLPSPGEGRPGVPALL